MKFIGIDPGQYGAIAVSEDKSWKLVQMPVLEAKKGRFDLDLHGFVKAFESLGSKEDTLVAIEEPPYIPTNGGFATRSLFKSYGEIRGAVIALGFNPVCVGPKVWKATVLPGKSKDKEATIAYVKTTYPEVELPKHPKHPKQDHDGIADAICLAQFARNWHFNQTGN